MNDGIKAFAEHLVQQRDDAAGWAARHPVSRDIHRAEWDAYNHTLYALHVFSGGEFGEAAEDQPSPYVTAP